MADAGDQDVQRLARELRAVIAFQGELGLAGLDAAKHEPASVPVVRSAEPRGSEPAGGPAAEHAATSARSEASTQVAGLGNAAPRRPARPSAAAPRAERSLSPELQAIRDDIGECTRCKLHQGRTHVVFGVGNPRARLMLIGEGPGRDEDLQGEPFVGAAGQLLDRMIKAMGLARGEVYIANIVKCRPPQNRDPQPDEIEACVGFLKAQIGAVKPEVLVGLGRVAVQTLLGETTAVSRLRGKWRTYEGLPLMPTFHPAYLLRTPADKKLAWEDLQQVMQRLGLPHPGRGGPTPSAIPDGTGA